MLRKIGFKFVVITAIALSLVTDSMAQTRIRFARNRTSATVAGTLASGATRAYVIRLAENQTLTINVVSGNNEIQIDLDDVHGHVDYYDGYGSVETDADGDHTITLENLGSRATRYTMTVSARY